ncbi:uncharacterized protein A1O9_06529 [Exophiala aquamarina CBS 119918]|uniref:Uncharacterized protein n=1 Tax=Exophiala aquamarina CBS 119918 TaxID=1182545 RepID=A0A072PH17_9EURO|nr:uncharacterized protein A1O9_06529 [Exophiala aquamarina CBS 119918]KEF58603.1 hypothetical protein A1O9_06529 [Exophiala aquamarina CBS 119918]
MDTLLMSPGCDCVLDPEIFQRVCNGLLKRGRLTVETFWMPGMGSRDLNRQSFPSSEGGVIDFFRLYCMLGSWEEAERILDAVDRRNDPSTIDNLSTLLVFVAYGIRYPVGTRNESKKGVEIFLRLLDNGADPNRMIVNTDREEIWLFPYIASSLGHCAPRSLINAIIDANSKSNFISPPKGVPTTLWTHHAWLRRFQKKVAYMFAAIHPLGHFQGYIP